MDGRMPRSLRTATKVFEPTPGEKLYLYIAVSAQAISSVLVREENATQYAVYYVCKILSETEGRYPLADKKALTLVYSVRKLRPYFQAHSIEVYTNLPLKSILQKPEASGRLVKWSVELDEFDIHYLLRPNIKSQALADFMVECTIPTSDVQPSTLPSPRVGRYALSKLTASTTGDIYKRKCIEKIHFPSIQGPWVIQSIDESREVSWINPILSFLQDGVLPKEPMAVTRLRRRAANFTIIGGELYKRAFTGPYLKCLPPLEADYALREVHSGVCGEHLGGRALAYKIMRHGFYWPTMKQDVLEFTRKCENCQLHSNLTHTPALELASLQSP
ncbi:uncharacterized protein LOC110100821 [Dendrobium catenatum]|uniref:uncharacterized protein LOC110100821 n=1 Tax=Dendrobium catenatum TaxID=906689 RepID=UPI0009F71D7C|nr:uncharacterized protein LOC110100821 [Dendrobium catenatum]